MKTLLLFLSITLVNFAFAQDEPNFPDMRNLMINYNESPDRYIFSDTALVRISPDTKQPPVDTLFAGDNITITGMHPTPLTIRGLKGPWLQIKYAKNGAIKNGYVWQGLVSGIPLRRGDLKFVLGIERRADSSYTVLSTRYPLPRYLAGLKVIQQGKLLAKAAFAVPNQQQDNTCAGKVMSGMGLTNVQNIVVITFTRQDQVIISDDYYFAFTNSGKLVRFPDKHSSNEPGLLHRNESFIFPNEKNGQPDMVIWKMIMEETTNENDKNGATIFETTMKESKAYTWDGVQEKLIAPVRKK